jgi:signal transduction histidine kinase
MSAALRKDEKPIRPTRGQRARPAPLDDQKRSFLRVVSHELRTPLNSILGFSEILATELYGPLGSDQYREYAEIIRTSGEKLLKLVNQVVEIARLQSGDIEIHLQPERLVPVLESLPDGLQAVVEARDLRFVVDAGDELEVLADSRALRAVFSNLLHNAVSFSPDGGAILVSARAARGRIEVVVHNEGDGVDAADLGRIILPFEQGQNALTRHSEGAGLGLALCDLNCRAMGGRLKLVSDRGQGFAAHVVLPQA